MDAVQSSRFITTKKSRELIRKLEQIAGENDAGKLQRQVYVAGRIKTENESIYYNIDAIHRAIQENRQISFVYLDWNLKKQLVPRPNGNKCVSPWALIWRDENYYLAAYDSEGQSYQALPCGQNGTGGSDGSPREGVEQFSQIDVTSYTNQTFGMFAGEESVVTMEFPKRLIGVVLDRFGREVDIRPMSEDRFPGGQRWRSADSSSDGWPESDRGPVSQRRKRYKSVMYSGFRIFYGNSQGGRLKITQNLTPFLYSFLRDPSLTSQGFFYTNT